MINSTVDKLPSDKENAVHSVTDQSKINSSDQLTNGNFPRISEDRKPTLPLLSLAQLNNVSDPVPNSNSPKATPDNKDWFLYRPRTRSAKKKLSFREVILISSDSEGSDVECTRNPYVMEIVPKTEIVSDDSVLDGVVTSHVTVTDNSEYQSSTRCGEAHQSTVSPLKALLAVNTSSSVKMGEYSQSNCSNDNDSTVNLSNDANCNQGVKDESYDSASSQTIADRNESKQKVKTGSSTKKDMISDVPPLEEAVVSHVIDTDNSELLQQQTIGTNSCADTLQPSASPSPSPVKLLPFTSPLEQDPQSNCCNVNNSSEPIADYISQIINPSDASNSEDNCSQAVRDKSNDTEVIIDDESQQNVAAMKEDIISDVAPLEEANHVLVTDNSELLEQQPIGSGGCDTSQQLSVSPVKVIRAIKTSLLVEMRNDTHSACFNDSAEPVADDISQIINSCGDLNNDDNCSQALKEETNETGSTEAIVNDESRRNITETTTKEEKVLDVPLLEETVVSHVIITKITDVLEQQAIGTGSCVEVYEPSISPIKVLSTVSTGPLEEVRQDIHSSSSNDNDSTEPVTDGNSEAKQNIISCADLSNEDAGAVKCSSYDIGSTEPVIDGLCDSKIIGSECYSSYGFCQNIEPNTSENESPELVVYGIVQTKRKDFMCECSTCSKCEYAMGNDQVEMVQERVSKLRPKCLQFELEFESDLNESMVQAAEGKRSSTPLIADSPQSSMKDASGLEDSASQRLEWSTDHDELMIDEGPDDGSNPSDSDENMYDGEQDEQKNDFHKGECDYDLTDIGDSKQNTIDTEISNAVYLSDDELLQKLSQQTERKSNFDSRSLSDDELVSRGRYSQEVTNDAVNFLIILPNSGVPRMNSMDEAILRSNDVPVSQNEDLSPVENQASPSSVSSKSQDDNMEESNSGCSEYEQESDQRPAEKEDKLLIRLKRRWSAGNSMNLSEIPQKRTHIETSTESDSDGQQIEQNKRTRRKPKKSSLQLAERMGGFFRKMSNSLRANGTKMKAKLSLGRRSLPNRRETGADQFVVTPYLEDKVVESMKGFVVVPDCQDIETEDDS